MEFGETDGLIETSAFPIIKVLLTQRSDDAVSSDSVTVVVELVESGGRSKHQI